MYCHGLEIDVVMSGTGDRCCSLRLEIGVVLSGTGDRCCSLRLEIDLLSRTGDRCVLLPRPLLHGISLRCLSSVCLVSLSTVHHNYYETDFL